MDTSETYRKLSDDASPLKPDYVVETLKWYEDPVYIKMCDCPEIQGLMPIEKGNFIHNEEYGLACIDGKKVYDGIGFVWLPRQDQLQEMVGGFASLESFWVWLGGAVGDTGYNDGITIFSLPVNVTSMEQLFLAFVMKEKYGKIWDKEGWTND